MRPPARWWTCVGVRGPVFGQQDTHLGDGTRCDGMKQAERSGGRGYGITARLRSALDAGFVFENGGDPVL
jgi:hypothetical protein